MTDYKITLEFTSVNAENPTDAAEQIATYLVDNANQLVFTVAIMDDPDSEVTIDLNIGE